MPSDDITLTDKLLSYNHPSRIRAMQHPFLKEAGTLSISLDKLQNWMVQDRLYAMLGYTRFLGILISKLDPPAVGPDHPDSVDYRQRLGVVSNAMTGIVR